MTNIARWIPFTLLTLVIATSFFFWKLDKSRELQIKPASEVVKTKPKSMIEGMSAPKFTLPALRGGEISLDYYSGKLVLLNIWATWCLPCREEMPSMERLYNKLKDYDFAMVAISIDKNIAEVRKFSKDFGLTFPIALDHSQKVASQYGITGVPETFLISRNGTILHHIIGPENWDNQTIIKALRKAVGASKKIQQAPK
jgi:peroxiredoxin